MAGSIGYKKWRDFCFIAISESVGELRNDYFDYVVCLDMTPEMLAVRKAQAESQNLPN